MHWWQTGIIYQIYPRSFQDSNGDGIGDLPGIIQRLDYLQSLNINALWLSPIFPSPMHDFGYDVADYTAIHPMFGTMADFDRLLAEAHARDLKVMLDLVPNHTSDEHAWFIESRSSRDNPRRDWYIWRDPAPGDGPPETRPPTNWASMFGGPAWTYDAATKQFYMHQFVSQQPELNYRHPDVLPAMLDNMRFWLDKGVDGFRVDVIWLMLKDDQFRDEPPNPDAGPDSTDYGRLLHPYTKDLPGVHDIVRAMRAVMDEYDERVMVGEIYEPIDVLMAYCGDNDECHLPFNFHLIGAAWDAGILDNLIQEYEGSQTPDSWPNWVLGNHDQHRIASRVGPAQARVAQMLLLTLRGTPTCYYGDELGMENVPIPPDQWQDPAALNQPGQADEVGRDPERTPMQWDASPNAGFTAPDVTPWLPLAADYETRNVAAQSDDPHSMLSLYRHLTALRAAEPAFQTGAYEPVTLGAPDVLAYRRTLENTSYLILLNLGDKPARLDLRNVTPGLLATVVLSASLTQQGPVMTNNVHLGANDGLIILESS